MQQQEIAAAGDLASKVRTREGEGSSSAIQQKPVEPTEEEVLAAAINISSAELEEAKRLAEEKEKENEAT